MRVKVKYQKRVFPFDYTSKPRPEEFVRLLDKLASLPKYPNIPFLEKRSLAKHPEKQLKLMKSRIVYGIKFVCYSGPDDVAWNTLGDSVIITQTNFCRILHFWRKPWLTFSIFLCFIKSIYFLQENKLRHSTSKMYSQSTFVHKIFWIITIFYSCILITFFY